MGSISESCLPRCGDWCLDLTAALQLLLHLKGPFSWGTRALSPGPCVSQQSRVLGELTQIRARGCRITYSTALLGGMLRNTALIFYSILFSQSAVELFNALSEACLHIWRSSISFSCFCSQASGYQSGRLEDRLRVLQDLSYYCPFIYVFHKDRWHLDQLCFIICF